VPVVLNVISNVPAFGLRTPLSHAPMSLVVVCAEGPLLVQRTVVPTFTVTLAGVNVKSRMETSTTEPLDPPPLVGG
jgi:hypothetical protein